MKKRVLALGMMILTVLYLTGCGNKVPEGYFTLESITEGDVTVKEDDLGEYGLKDCYAVFENEGNGYLVVMNSVSDFSYDEEDSLLKTGHGDIAITSNGKTVTIADGKVSMKFKKSDDDAPEKPEAKPEAGAGTFSSGGNNLSQMAENLYNGTDPDAIPMAGTGAGEPAAYWNADWFGWFEIDGFMNEYDQFDGLKYPILGTTSLDQSGNGTIHLWDNDGDVVNAVCTNNGYGLTESGTMVVESGTIITRAIKHADFTIDPGTAYPEPHDGYIYFNGRAEDENGDTLYTYDFYLMKWGQPWAGFEEDKLPVYYDWYLEQIDQGNPMPDRLPN